MEQKKDGQLMTHRLPVMLTVREKKNLDELAAAYGETMSGILKRLLVEEYTRYVIANNQLEIFNKNQLASDFDDEDVLE